MKKRWLFTTLFAIVLCAICFTPFRTEAKAATVDGLTFRLNSDRQSYTVTGCGTATSGELVIPATYNGWPVTDIGGSAFENRSSLTSVTIPDSVTTIGNAAFRGCSGLTSVTIPDSVTRIYDQAFESCISLTSIIIPDSVTTIGNAAFRGCSGLTSVTIGNGVTSIGVYVFWYCDSLTNISVSERNPNYSSDSCGVLFNKEKTELICATGALSGSYTIPDSVTSIGDCAFYDCDSLTSVTIPNSVTTIGNYAFSGCNSLTSVTISDSVTAIGTYAFQGCSSLTSVTIPDSVTSINSYTFNDCDSLTSVTIPDSVTSIDNYAFYACDSLTSVTLGDSVTSIGIRAFWNCDSLTSILASESNPNYSSDSCGVLFNKEKTELICAPRALFGSYTIPDGVTSIGDYAFYNCDSLISVTIDNSVTSIGVYAFYSCNSMTSVTIGDSVTTVGHYAFSGCSSVTSITVGDSVTTIGYDAFDSCTKVNTVYYSGTESKWEQNRVAKRINLEKATIHYNHIHDYSLIPAVTVPATCTEAGYTEYTCAYGEKYRAYSVPPLGHIKGNDTTIVAPTCYSVGYTKSTCQRCKLELRTDYVDALGHDFSGEETFIAPECVKEGYTSIQCTRCTETKHIDYVDPLGHSMIYETEVAATCTEDGHTTGTLCSRCGFLGTASKIEKGHSYKTITTNATLTTDGTIENKCTACGDVTSTTTIARPATFTLSTTNYIYNGQANKPAVIVKDANGKTLVNGTDYTVTYPSGCANPGTYNVTVTLKGNYSGSKTLTFTIKPAPAKVTSQPKTQKVEVGEKIKFTVGATGDGLKYQWQSSSNGKTWKNCSSSSATKATFTFTSKTSHNGNYYCCKVTDSAGNVVYTSAVRAYVLSVTTQPKTQKVEVGEKIKFTVGASGDGLKYQWQSSTNGKTWKNCSSSSAKKATFSFTSKTSHNGNYYRCKVTDSAGNVVYTSAVRAYVLGVTTQPKTQKVESGDKIKLTVKATGDGLKYQWQSSTNGKTWKNCSSSSAKKATFSFTSKTSHNGNYYRCKVTDSAGNVVYTSAIRAYVLGIKDQPDSKTVTKGKTAKFTVEATGHSVKYQWQVSTDGGKTWKNCTSSSAKKATFSFTTKTSHSGNYYRCKITDSAKNSMYTSKVKLTVKK